mmetsp:Transcript_38951/g.93287  ORF Transcript_38951/g.93287 Transcript_38951/m.93287 type:complete len:202 (-) Transcript_38951:16-621(-)
MGTSISFVTPASAVKVTVILFVLASYATSPAISVLAFNSVMAVLTIVSIPSSRDAEDGTGRVIPATTDAVAGVAHGRTVVPAWNVIFMSLRASTPVGGPITRSHSASPPMFKAVPSLLQEQLRPGAEFRPSIKGDSTLQTALSVAVSPGKRERRRADRMLAHGAVVGDTCAARRRLCGSVGKPRGHRGRVSRIRCVLYKLQ